MKRSLALFLFPLMLQLMTACDARYDGSENLMFMWFDVDGKVVNEAGEPIPGISVIAESAESVTTDETGCFSVRGGGPPSQTAAIRCMDTDKEINGRYTTKTTIVELEKYKDGQGWTEGYYRNREEVVIVLTEEFSVTPLNPGS